MKITKYLHSCLLVENDNKIILLDPGIYTEQENVLNLEQIPNIDIIGITHEHFDHMSIPFIKKIIAKYPQLQIFSNSAVKNILEKENISVQTENTEILKMEHANHEKIWMGPSCENVEINLFDKFSHPGDSLSFTKTNEILALPIAAPWGSTNWAIEKALEIKPKIIIPIHDYQLKDEVRIGMCQRLEEYFKNFGIIFKKMETGQTVEV